jgi:hypothetical protein
MLPKEIALNGRPRMNMQRNMGVGILLIIITLLAACNLPLQSITQTDGKISTWIDAPLNGSTLLTEPYEIVYHGGDAGGIASMELSVNGEVIALNQNPSPGSILVTLRHTWTPPGPGTYTIRARAQALDGQWSEYAAVTVTVGGDTPTFTPSPSPTSTPAQASFFEPSFSPALISQLNGCTEKIVTVEIGAVDPDGIKTLVLFYRLADQLNGELTNWYNITMNPLGQDRYRVAFQPAGSGELKALVSNRIDLLGANVWKAHVQVQFVIQDINDEVTRSNIYPDSVTLKGCGP